MSWFRACSVNGVAVATYLSSRRLRPLRKLDTWPIIELRLFILQLVPQRTFLRPYMILDGVTKIKLYGYITMKFRPFFLHLVKCVWSKCPVGWVRASQKLKPVDCMYLDPYETSLSVQLQNNPVKICANRRECAQQNYCPHLLLLVWYLYPH